MKLETRKKKLANIRKELENRKKKVQRLFDEFCVLKKSEEKLVREIQEQIQAQRDYSKIRNSRRRLDAILDDIAEMQKIKNE